MSIFGGAFFAIATVGGGASGAAAGAVRHSGGSKKKKKKKKSRRSRRRRRKKTKRSARKRHVAKHRGHGHVAAAGAFQAQQHPMMVIIGGFFSGQMGFGGMGDCCCDCFAPRPNNLFSLPRFF